MRCHADLDTAVLRGPVHKADAPVAVRIHPVAEDDGHHVHRCRRNVERLKIPEAGDVRALRPDATVEADDCAREVVVHQPGWQYADVGSRHQHIATAVTRQHVSRAIQRHDRAAPGAVHLGLQVGHANKSVRHSGLAPQQQPRRLGRWHTHTHADRRGQ